MTKERRSGEEKVRSIAEIRGQYGLADEEFRVLAEGSKDRTVGTVLGREPRPVAKRMIPTEQAVMGTARLEQPKEVKTRVMVRTPKEVRRRQSPLRWWPLALGALVPPAIVAYVLLGGEPTPQPSAAPSAQPGEHIEAQSQPAGGDRAALPRPRRPRVHSSRRPRPADPAASAAPSASASAAPEKPNALPAFPELEEQNIQ